MMQDKQNNRGNNILNSLTPIGYFTNNNANIISNIISWIPNPKIKPISNKMNDTNKADDAIEEKTNT